MASRKKKVPLPATPAPENVLTGPVYAARLAALTPSDDFGAWRYVVDGMIVRTEPA